MFILYCAPHASRTSTNHDGNRLFCALSSCSMSLFFLLQVLDVMNGNVYHVQLPYETHPFLHSHVQTVDKTFEHSRRDTQFIDGPEVKIQYEFVLL